ncbi:hypothetical protein HMPREF0083_04423 [Aneurinibacillus aneurinilyticus ATCC 12856]|jgi:hypothetical protein|uniref:Uncharacterized protein n=1 Tax=Aneurinibacillus aneurinilyticus ATCC 12856 TaxID=649747 RepID=U1WFY5_ANEAE|nr:hypothetical protein HMPREF0083_04423 [Aneurinibacillus aneurinilyticus ATCC 12856]
MTDISGLFLMKGRIHLIFIFLLYDLCQNFFCEMFIYCFM